MRIDSGKLVIGAMFGLALLAAAFGLWFRHTRTRQCLELWGPPGAQLIAQGGDVTVRRFDPPAENFSAARPAAEAERHDATAARGILNIRQALIEDSTFLWQVAPPARPPAWRYAIEFGAPPNGLTVLFDPDTAMVANPANGRIAPVDPRASDDLRAFCEEQFAAELTPAP